MAYFWRFGVFFMYSVLEHKINIFLVLCYQSENKMGDKPLRVWVFLLVAFIALPLVIGNSLGSDSAQSSSAWAFSSESLLWLIFMLCILVAVLAIYIVVKSVIDRRKKISC